jgi:hypothetical protein
MRPIASASDYERCTHPYVFDRVEVSANVFAAPPSGTHHLAIFQRETVPADFCILGAFHCEFPSGPNLAVLAWLAAEIMGADGFYGIRSARRLNAQTINRVCESEGWALFDVDGSGWCKIERNDEAAIFPDDDAALDHVRARAAGGSALHAQALRIHEMHAPLLQRQRAVV